MLRSAAIETTSDEFAGIIWPRGLGVKIMFWSKTRRCPGVVRSTIC